MTQPAAAGQPPRRLGLVGQPDYVAFEPRMREFAALALEHGAELHVEDRLSPLFPDAPRMERDAIDLLVTMGGDGTLLRGARLVARHGTPVLGINLGRLGFLTAIAPDEIGVLGPRLFAGDYWIDERFTLEAVVEPHDSRETQRFLALNDAVLHKGGFARVVRLRVEVDGQEVGTYSSDGIILSTPTGSTAYSLSAAGPVVVPTVDCILATPICPHTLGVRPVVLPAASEIVVEALAPIEELILTVDGQDGAGLRPRDRLRVRRGAPTVRLVRFGGQTFFSTLRRKLNWALESPERARARG